MRRSRVLAAALLLGLGPAAPAEAPVDDALVRQWVRELDDDRFAVREAALRRLVQAGKAAVEPVAAAAAGKSLEVTERAFRILEELSAAADRAAAGAARSAVARLAESGRGPAAARARLLLRSYQQQIVFELQQGGARPHVAEDKVVGLSLDQARPLDLLLPLLRQLPDLEVVSLSNPQMTDALMPALRGLPKLHDLNLYRAKIGDEGLKCLKDIPNLRSVPMGETQVTDAGLAHLKGLTRLEYLGLRGNRVTDAGLVHLKDLTNLTGLYLGETQVTDAGLVHLRGMTKLTYLRLHTTRVTDAGLEHLKALTALERLDLGKTQVTPRGVAGLKEALPQATIVTEPVP